MKNYKIWTEEEIQTLKNVIKQYEMRSHMFRVRVAVNRLPERTEKSISRRLEKLEKNYGISQ